MPIRVFALSTYLLTLLSLTTAISFGIPVRVDAAAAISGSAAAKQLEHIKNELHPILWQGGGELPATPTNGPSDYEVSATIQGCIGWGDQNTLLLKMSSITIEASVPKDTNPSWMNSGVPLRLILRDNTDTATNSVAAYVVVAAAPESDVASLESQLAAKAQVSAASYRQIRASQSLPTDLPPGHPICALSPNAMAIYPYYRAVIRNYNRRLDDLTVDKITSSILAYSSYYRVDPRLIMAMIIAESGFDPHFTSRTGAMGLGQLMPGTAAGLGLSNPYDPVQNVGAAVKILSDHVNEYGGQTANGLVPINTLLLTMAAYNAGGGAVRKYHGVPPFRETQNYVRKVSTLYREMCGG